MISHPQLNAAAILVAVTVVLSGCQSMHPNWTDGWKGLWGADSHKVQNSKFETPAKMAVIWSPASYSEPGKAPTRGFGGRIYFYNGANQPIAVEGQLVVYAYDDGKPETDNKTPDRKYVFTPEQFTQHASPTELGASYSVWLPWDDVGQPQTELSLLPIFTAASGQLVIGQSSKNTLPGPATPARQTTKNHYALPPPEIKRAGPEENPLQRPATVQQASFQEPASASPVAAGGEVTPANAPTAKTGVEMMSINLPNTLTNHLAAAEQQPSLSEQWAAQRAARTIAPLHAALDAAQAAKASQATPGVVSPPWTPPPPLPTRSELGKLPAPGARSFPPSAGQTLKAPFHAEQQSGPPVISQSALNLQSPASWSTAGQTQR